MPNDSIQLDGAVLSEIELTASLSADETLAPTIGEVVTIVENDHAELTHLDFASSGHTGFQAALTAGNGIDITDNVISNTGVTNMAVNASGCLTIWKGLQTV